MRSRNPYRSRSDEELVRSVLGGDADAYAEVIARYKNMVYGVILHVLPRDSQAEDIAQETFIDGYFRLGSLKDPASLAPWLYGMAKRKALHYCGRRRQHADIDVLADFLQADYTSPEEWVIRKETRAAVRSAMSVLSEKNRIAAELFYFENQSVAEIAKRLSLSQGTVKSRLYEARAKLKGELAYMMEQKNQNHEKSTLPAGFDEAVREKIHRLRYYYALNGGSSEGLDALLAETESLVNLLPESDEKQAALAEVYMHTYYRDKTQKEYYDKAMEAAKKGKNGKVVAGAWITKILSVRDNYEEWLRMLDEEALPEVRALGDRNGEGQLLFWRGAANIRLKHVESARADFKESARLCDADEVYRACAICGVKNIDLAVKHAEDPTMGIDVVSETCIKQDGKLIFANQPGFSSRGVFYEKHRWDAIHYYASRAGRMFYDLSMSVGETRTAKDGSTFTLVSLDAAAETPAGEFKNCMHVIYTEDDYTANVWYEKDVGLVKAVFTEPGGREESYLLDEYDIVGGDGYFPFAEKNRWHYVNPDLPEYLYQCFEFVIEWTDGTRATLSTLSYVNFRKGHETSAALDGEYHIDRCDNLCDAWKLEEAVDALKAAVRVNTDQNSVHMALHGIETLGRFAEYHKKGWRICPSSVNGSIYTVKDGRVFYDESGLYSFGPYRFGTRFEENRIFGAKPFRYLQELFGRIWDEKWIPGYTETRVGEEDRTATLTVSEGGTVTTAAGTFADTVKVTIIAEKPGKGDRYYFADGYRHTNCGKKEYWFARGVGIVRFDCTWGDVLSTSCELVSYSTPAADDSCMPVQIGNAWEYDELNLTREGYRAKRISRVACGMDGRYLFTESQEFIYQGTEEEYDAFKASLAGKK